MKKNVRYIMFAMLAVFGLAACDESDYEYVAPEAVTGSQVYFPTTNPSSINLEGLSGEVVVPIMRMDSTKAMVVNLVTESTSDKYTIPETVAFAAGEKEANLTISYAGLEYEDIDTLRIKVSGETTPYGTSEYVVAVGCPAPWTPWIATKAQWVRAGYDAEDWPLSETESTCTYTYTNYTSGSDTGLPIYYRRSLIEPSQGQFKVEHWAAGTDFYIEYNSETGACQVLPQYVMENSQYGSVYISDVPNYDARYTYSQFPCVYDKTTGRFVLTTVWYVSEGIFGNDPEYIQVDGFYIPDYSVTAVMEGTLTDTNQETYALLNITGIGADVESVKALVVSKSDDASAVADAIAAGDVECDDLVLGNNKLPLNDLTGELQVVIVTLAGGELMSVQAKSFEYYGGGAASPWQSIGTGLWTDVLVMPTFFEKGPRTQYEVEIMENTENPGMYRVMDPYGAKSFPFADVFVANEIPLAPEGSYVTVDATDPDAVIISEQSLHIDLGFGECTILTAGYDYLAELGEGYYDVLKQNGYFGRNVNGVLSFPAVAYKDFSAQMVLYFGDYVSYNKGAITEDNNFVIVLPSAMTPSAKRAAKFARNLDNAILRSNFNSSKASKVSLPKMPKSNFKLYTSIEK